MPHAPIVSRNWLTTTGAAQYFSAIRRAARAWRDGILRHRFQRGDGAFLVVEGEQAFAVRIKIGPAGVLQDHRAARARDNVTLRSLNQPQRERT